MITSLSWRRLARFFVASLLLALVASTFVGPSRTSAQSPAASPKGRGIYGTTFAYVVQFYPLWLTYYQSFLSSGNRLVGPDRISHIYQVVVAINDDTLYASTFLKLATQPVILTIPQTTARYSILLLDPYGNILNAGQPPLPTGIYGFTGPGYTDPLPPGVTKVPVSLNTTALIFRIDKYTSTNENMTREAKRFRRQIVMQPLCDYLNQPCPAGQGHNSAGGKTLILPEAFFAVPFKTAADELIAHDPLLYLKQLQSAVLSSNTPPLTPEEQELSDRFNALFNGGNFGANPARATRKSAKFAKATQAAHSEILNHYLDSGGSTHWIHFTNIGQWGEQVLDRAGIAEFIQYGNGPQTAAYYHAFKDARGKALTGSNPGGYVLTFRAEEIPTASRFWSVTAYTPNSIELIKNTDKKYVVAGYTPGLVTNPDGSISIYMAVEQPSGVPKANWLPIPNGAFNIMLRVYGPEGSVANNTYIPPPVERARSRSTQ